MKHHAVLRYYYHCPKDPFINFLICFIVGIYDGVLGIFAYNSNFKLSLLIPFCILSVILLTCIISALVSWITNKNIINLVDSQNAYSTTAKFIDIGKKNGNYDKDWFYHIFYEYMDEYGNIRKVKSIQTFTLKEIEYLKNLDDISINCKRKNSVITQDLLQFMPQDAFR